MFSCEFCKISWNTFFPEHLQTTASWNYLLRSTFKDRHKKELKNPIRKTNMDIKTISFIGPSVWKNLPHSIKKTNSLNTFKDNVKKHSNLNNECVSICEYVCVSVGLCIFYTCEFRPVCFPLPYPFSCLCVCVFFFLLLLSRLPSLIFVLTWGTTMKLRRFCAFCAIAVIVDAIHICLQRLYFNFSFLDFNFLIFFFYLG